MNHLLRRWRLAACILAAAMLCTGLMVPQAAIAGTTGSITGIVRDAATGAPIANVNVTAASLSQTATSKTDARGFFALNGLTPDTYTVSFEALGYAANSQPGYVVQQDQTLRVTVNLEKELKTIAAVHASGSSNLVKSNTGSDVYNVSGEQLNAATGGNKSSQTLYTFLSTVPGITVSGGIGAPRIRGGDTHDIGYEFDGIPIRERLFGLFTSNITTVGIGNVEVYTGGLPANAAGGGAGVINTVVKTGTWPPSGDIMVGMTSPDYNHYLSFEYGGQTANRKFSYYVSYGGVNSRNVYNNGNNTYPNWIGGDISGPVTEHDIVGNFHYRTDPKDDFQFLIQNGLGDFNFNYMLPGKGEPGPLSITPCPGYAYTGKGYFGAAGGTAPNGQACPLGFYWSAIPGAANIWHHYSGIGKIQWNRTVNDHSFLALRLAENFNQYIFDQPLADPNLPAWENPGDYLNINPACPLYPYQPGTPVQDVNGNINKGCAYDFQSFYGDRKSHMYFLSADYTNEISPNVTLKFGAGQEYDINLLSYVGRDSFNQDGTYPNRDYAYSDVPTHVPFAYGSADVHMGKLLLSPGLYWSRIWYGAPANMGGSHSNGLVNPTFNGTWTFDPSNVLRFSYGNSSSFVGSAYLYREFPVGPTGAAVPNLKYGVPSGASSNAEIVQSGDLMWEHSFGGGTSLRIGPWYNNSIGYYESYRPLKGFLNGTPQYGPAVASNTGRHHALGLDIALNHIDNHSIGFSYWLTGTYDNFWSTSTSNLSGASPVFAPLPSFFTSQGILDRNPSNPLFTGTFLADMHSNGFHIMPELFYNYDTFYHVGYVQPKTGNPYLLQNNVAGGWWLANLTVSKDLTGAANGFTVGMTVHNMFAQNNGPAPCFVVDSTGCAGTNGPDSGYGGLTPGTYIYQQVANGYTIPQSVEFFLIRKL
jgi:hypothetical protein